MVNRGNVSDPTNFVLSLPVIWGWNGRHPMCLHDHYWVTAAKRFSHRRGETASIGHHM
jgi:hypothetical protein